MSEKEWGVEEWADVIRRLEKLDFRDILKIAEAGGLDFYGKGSKNDYIYTLDEIPKKILLEKLKDIEKKNH